MARNSKPAAARPDDTVRPLIRSLRGQRVILDFDLAQLYGVETRAFNQAVKRNLDRFPGDFGFQLTVDEFAALRSQIAISKKKDSDDEGLDPNWSQSATSSVQSTDGQTIASNSSQFVMSSRRHRGAAYRPWAFTEHGALMAANILRSARAVQMSIFVIRAFVRMREELATNAAILKGLAEIDRTLLVHDSALRDVYRKLLPLLETPPDPPKSKIGFHPGNC